MEQYKKNKKKTEVHAEKSYTSPDFTSGNKITCLSLHYNGSNSYLFVNGHQITKFKAKDSEINKHPIAIGNTADNADLSDDDNESGKLYGNIYNFSVDYSPIENTRYSHLFNEIKNCINE